MKLISAFTKNGNISGKFIYWRMELTLSLKQEISYILKVCVTALLVSIPVTSVIGWAYVWMIFIIEPTDYAFTYLLGTDHLILFIAITAAILFISKRWANVTPKRRINDRPIVYSIMLFLGYLLVSGQVLVRGLDGLLFSYGPMFLITYICSKVFDRKVSALPPL